MICKRGTLWYLNHETRFDARRCILRCANCGECFGLQRDGIPFYARGPVRDRGGDPDAITLDEAIALLRASFPAGIPEYRGTPLRDVPEAVWRAAYDDHEAGDKWITAYPADWRYVRALAKRFGW